MVEWLVYDTLGCDTALDISLSEMKQMTTCNVKGVTHSDKPTEINQLTAVHLSTERFSIILFVPCSGIN